MDVGLRRKATAPIGLVAKGSVWESRMKLDEVKGGIKVFNDEQNGNNSEENDEKDAITSNNGAIVPVQVDKRVNLSAKQSPVGTSGKRKTWKSESLEGSPIQIARQRSEMGKNLDEQCKELSVSVDGIKRSPIQRKKTRSEAITKPSVSVDGIEKSPIENKKKRSEPTKELSLSVDGTEKSPTRTMKARSVSQKVSSESSDATEKNSIQLRKVKSECTKAENDNRNEKAPELRKVKSESIKVLDETLDGNMKIPIQLEKVKSVSSKDFEDNGGTSKGLTNGIESNSVKLAKGPTEKKRVVDESSKSVKEPAERIEKSIVGIQKTLSDENCKEFGVCEEKIITSNVANVVKVKPPPPKVEVIDDHDDEEDSESDEFEEVGDEEIEVEIEKKSLVLKEISVAQKKPKKIVVEEKKLHHSNERPVTIPSIVKKQSPPLVSHARVHPSQSRTKPVSDGYQQIPRTHSKLHNFVDLVMWRDVSRSAFVFGVGTFFIISSSYTKDLNISLISVLSYLGLVYLAAIFLFRSFINRGAIDLDDSRLHYVVGEEEAVWLVKLVLPYVNEFLLQLKALFSGDPATTMKLAVLLFVLARCGSSITIWKMAKLGFFGVFTLPKLCSSYSTEFSAYGTFWIRRFRDAWESCTHKKAVGFIIFTLVWNLSSMVARIWAVFMLFVAFRYYQHSFIGEGWAEVETRPADSSQGTRLEAQFKDKCVGPFKLKQENKKKSF